MALCGCGCGDVVGQGATFRRGHHQRVNPSPGKIRGERYTIDPLLGCRLWNGATTRDGTPIMRDGGKVRSARRVYYERERGPLGGRKLESLCKERRCVEPTHHRPKPRRAPRG